MTWTNVAEAVYCAIAIAFFLMLAFGKREERAPFWEETPAFWTVAVMASILWPLTCVYITLLCAEDL